MQNSSLRVYPSFVTDSVVALCPIRRAWVENAGFGAILDLKISKVDRSFIFWLESKWDWKRQVLHIRDDYEFVIDEQVISWITGLPIGEDDFPSLRLDDNEYNELDKAYDTKGGIEYTNVYNLCIQELESKFWFMRHFILLTFGCLFCMNKYNFITPKLLPLLKKKYMTDPAAWNWCAFLFGWLTGRGKEPGKASAIVLMVIYVFNLVYRWSINIHFSAF